MKYFLSLLGLALLTGAGCRPALFEPPSTSEGGRGEDPLCTAAPTENEAGAKIYPVAETYRRLPQLGQIYTALDCGNHERALLVKGFEDQKYRAGITLRWSNGAPPSDFEAVLKELGFFEDRPGVWLTREPLSLEELIRLQPFMKDQTKNGGLEAEDCLACG